MAWAPTAAEMALCWCGGTVVLEISDQPSQLNNALADSTDAQLNAHAHITHTRTDKAHAHGSRTTRQAAHHVLLQAGNAVQHLIPKRLKLARVLLSKLLQHVAPPAKHLE